VIAPLRETKIHTLNQQRPISLEETIKQIVESWQQRLNTGDN
jgi:hypothetical protein